MMLHGIIDQRRTVRDGVDARTCTLAEARAMVEEDHYFYMSFSIENRADPAVFFTAVRHNVRMAYFYPRGFPVTEEMWWACLKAREVSQIMADPPFPVPAEWRTAEYYETVGLDVNGMIIATLPVRTVRAHAFRAVRTTPRAFGFVAETFRDDKEMVLAALECGEMLEFASMRLQADPEVVHRAIQQNPKALQFAAPIFRRNKALVLKLCRESPSVYFCCTIQGDMQIVCAVVARHGYMPPRKISMYRRLIDYTKALVADHAAFLQFDLGATAALGLLRPEWKNADAPAAQLYAHGRHFGLHFKKKIFDYLVGGALPFREAKSAAALLRPAKERSWLVGSDVAVEAEVVFISKRPKGA